MFALLCGCARPELRSTGKDKVPAIPRNSVQVASNVGSGGMFDLATGVPNGLQPPSSLHSENAEYWDMTLSDAILVAMQNSEVLRDLGGRVVSQPGNVATQLNPSLIALDPRNGVDAALSNFDTQLSSTLSWQNNNRGLKQPPFGVTNTEIKQAIGNQRASASKLLRTGTRLELNEGMDYDRDDLGIPPNRFASAFTPFVGVGVRHPLARGGGRQFTEVAGPGATPGIYNGIVIAQIRTDIANDEYQIALRDFLYNTVRTYWLLNFAHQRFAVEQRKLTVARRLHEITEDKIKSGSLGPDVADVTLEQVLAAELACQNVFSGAPERLISGILGPNGAFLSGSELGVLSLERRLRFLMGLPAADNRIIRPIEASSNAFIVFDWEETLSQALSQRPELLRQNKVVRQKRLELAASKSHLLPTVDLVSQARVLGFGNNLYGSGAVSQDGALNELLQTELKELSAGVEVRWPVGNRIGHAAVRSAMLALTREDAIFQQQQLQVNHEVASALRELQRSQKVLSINQQRKELVQTRLANTNQKFDLGFPVPIEQTLDFELKDADATLLLALSQADHQIAITSLSVARGVLLSDLSINFAQCETAPTEAEILAPRAANAVLLTPVTTGTVKR